METGNRKRIFRTLGILAGALLVVAGLLMLVGAVIAHRPLHFQSDTGQTVFWVFGQPGNYMISGIVFLIVGAVLLVSQWRRPKEN